MAPRNKLNKNKRFFGGLNEMKRIRKEERRRKFKKKKIDVT